MTLLAALLSRSARAVQVCWEQLMWSSATSKCMHSASARTAGLMGTSLLRFSKPASESSLIKHDISREQQELNAGLMMGTSLLRFSKPASKSSLVAYDVSRQQRELDKCHFAGRTIRGNIWCSWPMHRQNKIAERRQHAVHCFASAAAPHVRVNLDNSKSTVNSLCNDCFDYQGTYPYITLSLLRGTTAARIH